MNWFRNQWVYTWFYLSPPRQGRQNLERDLHVTRGGHSSNKRSCHCKTYPSIAMTPGPGSALRGGPSPVPDNVFTPQAFLACGYLIFCTALVPLSPRMAVPSGCGEPPWVGTRVLGSSVHSAMACCSDFTEISFLPCHMEEIVSACPRTQAGLTL